MGRHERPSVETVRRTVATASAKQRRARPRRRRKEQLNLTSAGSRERDDRLDMLEVSDLRRRATTPVGRQTDLHKAVYRNTSTTQQDENL